MVTTVLALLLLHAFSAAAPPDAAETASAHAAAWMPRVAEKGGGGGGGGGGTSRDPYGILPEGPAADEEKECAHLAGRMLLCIADYEARHLSTREEAGGGGGGGGGENTTQSQAQSQSQERERRLCRDIGLEHWKCVNRQASSSLFGGYTRIRRVRHGYMCFSTFDIYFAVALELYGEWGQDEATVMTSFISPGDTVVEVGGHIGTLTLPLAKKVGPTGKCIVFEPQRLLSQYNAANIALNGLSQVRLLQAAAGERSGGKAFIVSYRPDAMMNLGGAVLSEEKEEDALEDFEEVDILSIDSLELDGLQLIKIDCEGCEEGALLGAKRTISKFTPVVYRESNLESPADCDRGQDFLLSLNYSCWLDESTLFREENFYGEAKNYFIQNGKTTVSVMLLCLPPRITLSTRWRNGGTKDAIESIMKPLKCGTGTRDVA